MDAPRTDAVIARLVESSYLEVVPSPDMAGRLAMLPPGACISITCSPTRGIGQSLDLATQLAHSGLQLVPHLAARMVRDRTHLLDILQQLRALRIQSVFIPGGDAKEPAGIYHCALDLLRAMADAGHEFDEIGIAAHPEGHPHASDATLLQALLDKQPYATYLVTQMCFDAEAIIRWLRGIRAAGVFLPAWIGLPGVADHSRLLKLSMRIGVGQSVRILMRQKGLFRKLVGFRPYRPDELLAGLSPYLTDRQIGIPGFHLFSFNDIERTERWRCETLARYRDIP